MADRPVTRLELPQEARGWSRAIPFAPAATRDRPLLWRRTDGRDQTSRAGSSGRGRHAHRTGSAYANGQFPRYQPAPCLRRARRPQCGRSRCRRSPPTRPTSRRSPSRSRDRASMSEGVITLSPKQASRRRWPAGETDRHAIGMPGTPASPTVVEAGRPLYLATRRVSCARGRRTRFKRSNRAGG
jgi:hypothetical protein